MANKPPLKAPRQRALFWRLLGGITLVGALGLSAPAVADEEVSRERLEELRERIGNVSDWLEEAQEDEDELLTRLREAEQAISQLNNRLAELQERAEALDAELAELRDEASTLEARKAEGRDDLRELVREAWMQGEHPALKLLLTETDPQEIARIMTYHEYLSQDGIKRLEAFAETLEELEENREATEATREDIEQTRVDVEARRSELSEQRNEREQALSQLQARISERESELDELHDDRDRLEGLLEEMEEEVADIEPPEDAAEFESLRAKLPWPVRGNVIESFGDAVGESDMQQNGIRIATEEEGEPVEAVHYGRVVFADWLRGFGLMVIIDHGDGYLSLYGHNSSVMRSAGEWVSGGDEVARSGSSGGQSEPGLYFEIRQNGQPVDPSDWLE